MFHHTHTSIETAGKMKLRKLLRDGGVVPMRKSKDMNKKHLRKYFYSTTFRIDKNADGDDWIYFNELNIPFFHGQEAH